MPLLINSDASDCHRHRCMYLQWFCCSLYCSFVSFANGAFAFLWFITCLLLSVRLSEWLQEYGPQPLHKSCCLLRWCFRLCLCFFFDVLASILSTIVRVKRFFSLRMMSTSAKRNSSYSTYSILFLTYTSYFGGKKGISRNKMNFFFLM